METECPSVVTFKSSVYEPKRTNVNSLNNPDSLWLWLWLRFDKHLPREIVEEILQLKKRHWHCNFNDKVFWLSKNDVPKTVPVIGYYTIERPAAHHNEVCSGIQYPASFCYCWSGGRYPQKEKRRVKPASHF